MFRYDPVTGELGVHRDGVESLNGRTLDRDGGIVQCSHGRRAVEREVDAEVTVLTERWAGGRYNSPNDVVVRRDGTIWFTDPAYGIRKDGAPAGPPSPAQSHQNDHESAPRIIPAYLVSV